MKSNAFTLYLAWLVRYFQIKTYQWHDHIFSIKTIRFTYITRLLGNMTYSEVSIWSSSMNGISSMPKSVGFNESLPFKDMRDWRSATLEAWQFKGWWTVTSTPHPCTLGLDTMVGIHVLRLYASTLFFCKESSVWTEVTFEDADKWDSCSDFWQIKNIIHTIV